MAKKFGGRGGTKNPEIDAAGVLFIWRMWSVYLHLRLVPPRSNNFHHAKFESVSCRRRWSVGRVAALFVLPERIVSGARASELLALTAVRVSWSPSRISLLVCVELRHIYFRCGGGGG